MPRLLPYYERLTNGVPLIEDWVANAGKVERIITQPCELEPRIIVEAFFEELPLLLWSLLKPDPLDLRARDVAPDTRESIHDRRRRRRKRPLFRFRVDELLAGELDRSGKIPKAVFTLGNLAQRVGWYLLVVDATSDFVVRWTSTAYQWQGCLPTPDWWKGTSENQWTPAGGIGIISAPWKFETAASTPNTFAGVRILQPARTEMIISASITCVKAQFTNLAFPVSAYLLEVETGALHTIFEGKSVSNVQYATGSIEHEAGYINEDRHWEVIVDSPNERVTADDNGHFTAFPITHTFLEADPP